MSENDETKTPNSAATGTRLTLTLSDVCSSVAQLSDPSHRQEEDPEEPGFANLSRHESGFSTPRSPSIESVSPWRTPESSGGLSDCGDLVGRFVRELIDRDKPGKTEGSEDVFSFSCVGSGCTRGQLEAEEEITRPSDISIVRRGKRPLRSTSRSSEDSSVKLSDGNTHLTSIGPDVKETRRKHHTSDGMSADTCSRSENSDHNESIPEIRESEQLINPSNSHQNDSNRTLSGNGTIAQSGSSGGVKLSNSKFIPSAAPFKKLSQSSSASLDRTKPGSVTKSDSELSAKNAGSSSPTLKTTNSNRALPKSPTTRRTADSLKDPRPPSGREDKPSNCKDKHSSGGDKPSSRQNKPSTSSRTDPLKCDTPSSTSSPAPIMKMKWKHAGMAVKTSLKFQEAGKLAKLKQAVDKFRKGSLRYMWVTGWYLDHYWLVSRSLLVGNR